MKKILSLMLSVIVIGTLLVGCKKETVKQPQQQDNVKKEEKKDSLPEIKLNEPFKVDTEYGKYEFTIESIKKTDERNRFSKVEVQSVVLLNYTYKNESFGEGNLYIDESAFTLMDDDGSVLNTYPVSDESRPNNQAVPIGGNSKASIAYGLPKETKNITVLFKRQGKAIAKAVIAL